MLGLPFGLLPVFASEVGPVFERVALEPPTIILSFLTKLAQQRNLVIANDAFGMPLFHGTSAAPAVQSLSQGESPVQSVEASFNAQRYYSHITALSPSSIGVDGGQYTVVNPFASGTLRPFVFDAADTFGGDLVAAASAKMGRMFANAIAYRVELAGWRNALGQLWAPNTSVRLIAPGAMIYTETEFLIRSVALARNGSAFTTTLTLILPGTFEGKIPRSLPWL